MNERVGDLVKLQGPTLIALSGIIAVYRDLGTDDHYGGMPPYSTTTVVVLEGGVKIGLTSLEGEFVSAEWETWAREMARKLMREIR